LLSISPFSYAKRGSPTAIWTGRDFLVTWFEDRVQNSNWGGSWPYVVVPHYVRTTRLSREGNVLDQSYPIVFETESVHQPLTSGFRGTSNGNEMLLTWNWRPRLSSATCTFTRRYDLTGKALDDPLNSTRCPSEGHHLQPTAV